MSEAMPAYVNCCAEARWISSETGIDAEVVHRVLIYDLRYLGMLGLASGPLADEHDIQPVLS